LEEEEEKVETWRRRRIKWRHGGGEESEREGHNFVIYRTSLPPSHHPLRYADGIFEFFSFFPKTWKNSVFFSYFGESKYWSKSLNSDVKIGIDTFWYNFFFIGGHMQPKKSFYRKMAPFCKKKTQNSCVLIFLNYMT
jgi:hypothetical protein